MFLNKEDKYKIMKKITLALLCSIILFVLNSPNISAVTYGTYETPFASDSMWNTPIGSRAEYVHAGFTEYDISHWCPANVMINQFSNTYPLVTVYRKKNWGKGWHCVDGNVDFNTVLAKMRVPYDYLQTYDFNDGGKYSFVAPDSAGEIHYRGEVTPVSAGDILEFYGWERCAQGSHAAANWVTPLPHSITNDGYPRYPFVPITDWGDNEENIDAYDAKGMQGGSKLSQFAGTIRLGELTTPPGVEIPHTLKFAMSTDSKAANYGTKTPGYVWPATHADSGYIGTNPLIEIGRLYALLPSFDCKARMSSELSWKICRALQKYGAFDVDTTRGKVDSRPYFQILHPDDDVNRVTYEINQHYGVNANCLPYDNINNYNQPTQDYLNDMLEIYLNLHIVTNAVPSTPKGPDSATPSCGEGQITSPCLCGGVEHSSGYCCSGVWQSTACSAPTLTASAYQFTGPVTLDGDLTEWQDVPSHSLVTPDDVVTGSSSSNSDASLTFKALWDSDNIYIALDVTDDVITSDDITQRWNDDSVEVYFDGNHDSTGPAQPDDFRPRLFPDGTWEDDLTVGKSATLAAQSKPGGYILEARIPYSSLGNIIPAADKILGFDVQMNDDDDGGLNDAVLMFSGDAQGGNFAGLADLRLESALIDISQPPSYAILKTASPPVIDGEISEFSGSDTITLSNSQGTTGDYKLMWDDTALYIAASVTDSQLNTDPAHVDDDGIWEDDSIELMFDTLHNVGTTLQNDDYKFFVNIQNVHTDSLAFDRSWNASYTSEVQLSGTVNDNTDTDTGYTIEIAIPWSNWGISPPAINDVWGFELVMNDRNSSGERDWSPWANTYQDGDPNNPDGWGDLRFSHPSDSNQDGCIETNELLTFIKRWKISSQDVPMPEVMEAIGLWNQGTGC
jgi:hypothetical protein